MRFPHLKRTVIAAVTLAAALAVNLSSEAAPEMRAACPANFAAVKVSSLLAETTSQGLIDVPESGIRFMQGGVRAGCVMVSFSTEAAVGPDNLILVMAVLDGTTRCEPDANQSFLIFGTESTGTWMKNFVCTGIMPGPHTIKLQFRSGSGGRVDLARRTLIVHHFR